MLLMPPRHGKSELASIRFPAWHLGHYPHHELINVGYNLDLPMGFSRKVREVFREAMYRAVFPDALLDPDSQSVEKWNTTAGGGFTAAGRGGGITGKGAHILIIDDPIKDQEEADSVLVRDKLWDWYQSTAYTRLAPGGGVLVIQTWWNDDDLAGRLQQAMAMATDTAEGVDVFEIIKYPALSSSWEYRDDADPEVPGPILRTDDEIDTKNPPLGVSRHLTLLRPKDFCLHEDRYPTEALKRIRANLQPRIWSALYQQNPVPDEGMYFKKEFFRYQRQLPPFEGLRLYTAWDFAIGEKQQNDWTVGATLLQDELDQLHVVEVFRMKGDSFQIVEAILDVATRWGGLPQTGYLLGAEDGQIWRAIEPLLKKRMAERRQYIPYEVLRPLTDKLARARPLQGRMQQGRIIFPEEAAWRSQAEQELLRFPAGAHDDVVDALAWAVHLCMGKEPPRIQPSAPALRSWRDKLDSFASSAAALRECGHMAA
jgi:predicted phage terminase large subunit-like protein